MYTNKTNNIKIFYMFIMLITYFQRYLRKLL